MPYRTATDMQAPGGDICLTATDCKDHRLFERASQTATRDGVQLRLFEDDTAMQAFLRGDTAPAPEPQEVQLAPLPDDPDHVEVRIVGRRALLRQQGIGYYNRVTALAKKHGVAESEIEWQ